MKTSKNWSLLSDFVVIITALITILIGIFAYRIYSVESRVLDKVIQNSASNVHHHFVESVDYTQNVLAYMAHQISEHNNSNDYAYILKLFDAFGKVEKVTQTLSWTLVSWVDVDDKLFVDAKLGILKPENAKNISGQDHIRKAKEEQWKIKFAPPRKGNTSGKFIIPSALGVSDINGKYIGSLIFGFEIEKMKQAFTKLMVRDDIGFALLDQDKNIVFSSAKDPNFFIKNNAFNNIDFQTNAKQDISYINIFTGENYYITKMQNYPYAVYLQYPKFSIWQEFFTIMKTSLIEIFCSVFIVFLLAYYFRKKIILPILLLADAANKLAHDETAFIPQVRSAELIILADALTRLGYYKKKDIEQCKLLEEKNAKIEILNTKLELNNTELTDLNTELENTAIDLQKALDSKNHFIRNMGHEIRTPSHQIASLNNYIEYSFRKLITKLQEEQSDNGNLLNQKPISDLVTEIESSISKLKLSASRNSRILNNVFDLSKLVENEMPMNIVEQDLRQIVQRSVSKQSELRERIKYINPETPFICLADEQRIFLVMEHILNNAGTFAVDGDILVTISNTNYMFANKEYKGVQVSVQDEGQGIPEGELDMIFELFAESSFTKSQAGGRGIGLTICRETITAHHGLIWAKNNQNGKGACFSFVLPCPQNYEAS